MIEFPHVRRNVIFGAKILLLTVLLNSHQTDAVCIRCTDFNREFNPNLKCPNSPTQCGSCISGFRETGIENDHSCERIQLPLLMTQPSNAYVSIEGTVTLECKFRRNDNVDCVWLRRGFHVDLNNRYKYMNSNGLRTNDCSITITKATPSDYGQWQCGGMGDSSNEGVMSNKVQVIRLERFVKQPENANVTLGSNATLSCTFDKEVDCVWLRRGYHLEIINRYSYSNVQQQGKNSMECSILIKDVTVGDVGKWQCGSMADSQKEGILSTEVYVGLHPSADEIVKGTKAPITTAKSEIQQIVAAVEEPQKTAVFNGDVTRHDEGNSSTSSRVTTSSSEITWLIAIFTVVAVIIVSATISFICFKIWKKKQDKSSNPKQTTMDEAPDTDTRSTTPLVNRSLPETERGKLYI